MALSMNSGAKRPPNNCVATVFETMQKKCVVTTYTTHIILRGRRTIHVFIYGFALFFQTI